MPLKRLLAILFTGLLLLAPSGPAPAKSTVRARPALWMVRDADTTIYLFGTIHLLKPGVDWFRGPVRQAFDRSDELVTEMIEPGPAEAQKLVTARAIDRSGTALSDRLSTADAAVYRAAMSKLALDPAQFERFEPWFVATMISVMPMQKLGYDPQKGVEEVLSAAGSAKRTVAFETMDEQLSLFDNLPLDQQIAFLIQSLREIDRMEKVTARMVQSWARGDPERLARLMNEGMDKLGPVRKVLITDRNARWAEWITRRLDQPGTVFVAVGAGHLAGADSVQEMLGARGLAVRRVR